MLKQLLEKANRKCEMRWKAYVYDPEQDNKLVKTSPDFDCIDCAMQFKRDYLANNCKHIVQIVAESKEQRNEGSFTVNSVNFDDKYKKAYEEAKKLGISISPSYGYPIYNNKALIQAISKKFPEKTPHISIQPYEGYYAINVVANGGIWHNLDNKKFSTVKEASKYAKQKYSLPQYIDILVSNNQPALESAQKNESIRIKTTFGSGKKSVDANYAKAADAVDVVRRTITDNTDKGTKMTITVESAQKNESLNLDSLTDEDAKLLIVHLQDFIKDKSSKYYHIDKIEAILKKKYKAESAQKNEEYKVGDAVKVDFNWIGVNPRHGQCKIINKRKAMAGKGDSNPSYEYLVKSTDGKQQWVNQNAIVESIKNEDIDDDSTGIIKKDDEKQMTEARGWRVSIKLQSKDNMNNINVEDAIEDALNDAGFTVNDVDAERM